MCRNAVSTNRAACRSSLFPGGEHVLACDTVDFRRGHEDGPRFLRVKCRVYSRASGLWRTPPRRRRLRVCLPRATWLRGSRPSKGAVRGRAQGRFRRSCLPDRGKLRVYIINEEGRIEARDRLAASQHSYVVPFEEIYGVAQYGRAEPQRQGIREGLSFPGDQRQKAHAGTGAGRSAARCSMHCGHCKGGGTCVDDCPGYVAELKHLEEQDRPEVAFGDEMLALRQLPYQLPLRGHRLLVPLRMQV